MMSDDIDTRIWPFYSPDAVKQASEMIARGDTYATSEHSVIWTLETEFTSRFRLRGRSLFVGSGTAALLAGYYGLNLPRGSEVLVPAYTFSATVTPLTVLGAVPVLCDVNSQTGLLDLDDAAARITAKTCALVITHQWGQIFDLRAARQFCDQHSLALIEDCSHAHGAIFDGFAVGNQADFSAYSLGTKKLISGGMGGMLVTKDQSILERALVLTQPRPRATTNLSDIDSPLLSYAHTGLGLNLRGSPISASLALDHLRGFRRTVAIKNANLRAVSFTLTEAFGDALRISPIPRDAHGTLYLMPMTVAGDGESRDRILAQLKMAQMRASRMEPGLQAETIVSDPHNLVIGAHSKIVASGGYPGASYLETHGIRLDTRDMYSTWNSDQLENLAESLAPKKALEHVL